MKKILLILFVTVLATGRLSAQLQPRRQQAAPPPPVPIREVSGIVKDSTDATIPGAVVKLESKTDTVSVATNPDGIFVFKNIKSANFVITVTSLGYLPLIKSMKNNDAVAHLVLDPMILKSNTHNLKEVTINGTPSITYKVDTVQFKASDYHVRENATVDELIKKMEGFEVGSDGSATFQGQSITKAKLNGKDYSGGNLAQAIQNLPADIVENIQVVDDYGDQAARTGIKDGDPQKILNITTRADRSVGTTGRLQGQAGNNDRYNARLFVQRINANQQIGIIGNLSNSQNGVASTGVAGGATNGGGGGSGVGAGARGGGSPGTTLSGSPSINYRDQYGRKVQINSSYSYNFRNNNSTNDSYGQTISTLGPTDFTKSSVSHSNSNGHNVDIELDYTIDSANFLEVRPSVSFSNSSNGSSGINDQFNHYATPSHQISSNINNGTNSSPSFNTTLLFSHNFKKPLRVFSLNFSAQVGKNQSVTDANTDTKYLDITTGEAVKDSIAHTINNRLSNRGSYRTSITYSEPLSKVSRLDFNGQSTISSTHNNSIVDSVDADGSTHELFKKDNIYNTVASESRGSLAYRYSGAKLNFGIGAQAIYRQLNGNKVNNSNDGENVHTSRGDFKWIPVLRGNYSWSRTERLSFTYSGTNQEPNFTQLQPFTDRTDPNHTITGNPNLRQTFTNSYSLDYNNYFPNSRFNISFGLNGTFIDDNVSTNRIDLPPVRIIRTNPATGKIDTAIQRMDSTTYVNTSGSHSYVGRYVISKQLDDRRYSLTLNGNITYGYNNSINNNVLYHTTNWRFDERFGPRISPNDDVEIDPFIGYDESRQFSSLKTNGSVSSNVRTLSLAIEGHTYFLKTFQVHYDASQNFIKGLTGLTNTSPLIIDGGLQKEFGSRRQFTLTFDVFDILHQANAIQQQFDQNGGYTYTKSNTLTRYFLIGFRLNLQKWSGRPQRNGRDMQRRGDGSFIYN
jgi:hypothetical protein